MERSEATLKAYKEGVYIAKDGRVFKRGLDGWFSDGGTVQHEDGSTEPMTMLTRHHEMVTFIEMEELETATEQGTE